MKKLPYNLFPFFLIFTLLYINVYSQKSFADLKYMSKKAEVILTGKVVKQDSYWDKNKTRIYTDVTLRVDEVIKGKTIQNEVVVKHPGGEVGEIGELYSHMPKFKPDEEILLFAEPDKEIGKFKVFNGENGKIQIIDKDKNGEKITALNKKISVIKKEIKKYIDEK